MSVVPTATHIRFVGQETAMSWSAGFAARAGAAKGRLRRQQGAGQGQADERGRGEPPGPPQPLRANVHFRRPSPGKCPDRNCLRKEDA